jgi:hypothetical protein
LEFTDKIRDRRDQDRRVPAVQQAVGKIRAAGKQAVRLLKTNRKKEQ